MVSRNNEQAISEINFDYPQNKAKAFRRSIARFRKSRKTSREAFPSSKRLQAPNRSSAEKF